MYLKKYKYLFAVLLLMYASPALAEKGEMPTYAYFGLAIGVATVLICIAIALSLVLRLIVEAFKKEKRKHILFMILGVIIFPSVFVYAEEAHYILHDFNYELRVKIGWGAICALILIGFLVGYFLTPKKGA